MFKKVGVGLLLLGMWPAVALAQPRLTWTPGISSTQDGYIVVRKAGTTAATEIARTSTPGYVDAAFPTLRPVCYTVFAYSAWGTSGPSNEVCLNVPGTPVDLSITTTGPNATLERVKVTANIRRKQ